MTCLQAQFLNPFDFMAVLKIILMALLLFQATTQARRNDCLSPLCGQSPFLIRFPYRLQDQPQSCGYPGFDLTCASQNNPISVLNLPNSGDFCVRDIDYLSQEIQLYDPNNCLPRRILNLSLLNTPFMASYSRDYTFLSCPPESLSGTHFTSISCLSNSTVSVVATLATNIIWPLNMYCTVISTLPVSVSWPNNDNLDDQDVRLKWNVPNCVQCEGRGGVCGFENSTSGRIVCTTEPKTDETPGLKAFKIIALSIVIPAVACSIFISCYTCIVGRRAARHLATIAPPPPPQPLSGLDESTIESYRKVVLGESRRLPGPNGATCPICLLDYDPKDTLRCIPQCDHCFHSDCIDEWLRLNGSCPLCRNSPSPARTDT